MRGLVAFGLATAIGCSSSPPTQPSVVTTFTPTLSLAFAGVATDSDTGAPLEGVRVCWGGGASPACGVSGADGAYTFSGPWPFQTPVSASFQACPSAQRTDFESRLACITLDPATATAAWSPVLHRRTTIEAGQSLRGIVIPADGYSPGWDEDECQSCRAVHINVSQPGTISFTLTGDTAGSSLELTLPFQKLQPDGTLEAIAGRDVVVLVKSGGAPARFTLATRFDAK